MLLPLPLPLLLSLLLPSSMHGNEASPCGSKKHQAAARAWPCKPLSSLLLLLLLLLLTLRAAAASDAAAPLLPPCPQLAKHYGIKTINVVRSDHGGKLTQELKALG